MPSRRCDKCGVPLKGWEIDNRPHECDPEDEMRYGGWDEPLSCIDGPTACHGEVEYRFALSGTGRSFPRCDKHWEQRLARQQEIDHRYPQQQPADFDPLYAGERWDDDY